MCERWICVSREPSGDGGIEFVVEYAGRLRRGYLGAVIGKPPSELNRVGLFVGAGKLRSKVGYENGSDSVDVGIIE